MHLVTQSASGVAPAANKGTWTPDTSNISAQVGFPGDQKSQETVQSIRDELQKNGMMVDDSLPKMTPTQVQFVSL
jgi:hypothetical protein